MNEQRDEIGLEIGGKLRPLVFDWETLARLRAELGPDFDAGLTQAFYDLDVKAIAVVLAIGFKRDWPEVTPELVMQAAPPLVTTIKALGQALNLALYGSTEAPAAGGSTLNRRARRANSSQNGKKRHTVRA